jgi:hypothetical protein
MCRSGYPTGLAPEDDQMLVFIQGLRISGLFAPWFLFLTLPIASANVITFEDLPDAYFFSSGDQNIGDFYSGITFGPDVTVLSTSRFGGYDSSGFPPHSGDVVIWDAVDPTITIDFASPIQSLTRPSFPLTRAGRGPARFSWCW